MSQRAWWGTHFLRRYATWEAKDVYRLGVITRPMLRFASTMSVKTKRWHRSGQLSNPFRSMQILGPSPFMPNGWLARDRRGMVQHVRSAWVQAEGADQALYELQQADAEALQPVR